MTQRTKDRITLLLYATAAFAVFVVLPAVFWSVIVAGAGAVLTAVLIIVLKEIGNKNGRPTW
jgi:hypothetical protein